MENEQLNLFDNQELLKDEVDLELKTEQKDKPLYVICDKRRKRNKFNNR